MIEIDAKGLHYRELNRRIKRAVAEGEKEILLKNVNGQRYIGGGVKGKVKIIIEGVPGNDLAAFMDGPTIIVKSNAQDCIGNTMNDGVIVVHGHAGDILGYGMRGGKIFIRDDVGYRVGIHMKAYKEKKPVLIVGGVGRDFLGEYMAGGAIIILGLSRRKPVVGHYIGTGMHGGTIYVRGPVEKHQHGREAVVEPLDGSDEKFLETHVSEFCRYFNFNLDEAMGGKFLKLIPSTYRPYGKIYAY
ncbi:TPA: hypothetical protein EYP26_00900 [Candidatus Bathyarchaeota archaeon]|nr:hypothetical protein [Candidatus Bathyarchaeota archaeon]